MILPSVPVPAKPPPCPRGYQTGAPDFVGVGAQRAGTSWWYGLISAHPEVCHPLGRAKELHYFDQYSQRPLDEPADAYALYFPRRPGELAGEWTPRYMFDYWVPRLLHDAAPDARILVRLRDPLERYRSGITHDLARNDAQLPHAAVGAAARGLYHQQLANVFRFYGQERVLVLQYERCVRDSAAELARTFDFLGLGRQPPPPDLRAPVNEARGPKINVDPTRERALLDFYEQDITKLLELLGPELDHSLWPTCGKLGLA
jgi:hypothetical protein